MRPVSHWNRVAREAVDAPSLEVLKGLRARSRGSWPCPQPGGWNHTIFKPKTFYDSAILWSKHRGTSVELSVSHASNLEQCKASFFPHSSLPTLGMAPELAAICGPPATMSIPLPAPSSLQSKVKPTKGHQ